jgi:hypothetical protein
MLVSELETVLNPMSSPHPPTANFRQYHVLIYVHSCFTNHDFCVGKLRADGGDWNFWRVSRSVVCVGWRLLVLLMVKGQYKITKCKNDMINASTILSVGWASRMPSVQSQEKRSKFVEVHKLTHLRTSRSVHLPHRVVRPIPLWNACCVEVGQIRLSGKML